MRIGNVEKQREGRLSDNLFKNVTPSSKTPGLKFR